MKTRIRLIMLVLVCALAIGAMTISAQDAADEVTIDGSIT